MALSLDEDQAMFSLITVSDIRHLGGCVSFDLKGVQIQKVAIQTCNDLVIFSRHRVGIIAIPTSGTRWLDCRLHVLVFLHSILVMP